MQLVCHATYLKDCSTYWFKYLMLEFKWLLLHPRKRCIGWFDGKLRLHYMEIIFSLIWCSSISFIFIFGVPLINFLGKYVLPFSIIFIYPLFIHLFNLLFLESCCLILGIWIQMFGKFARKESLYCEFKWSLFFCFFSLFYFEADRKPYGDMG